ncbi:MULTISPECIES: coiled-coil domain-containing protein [Helcococcus]|uniref:Peptidoglycan hydrolase PcsB coiled-coil domain-containing protein n=1 Tax=Helcococcus bovis TaxID=3153252 RepID=A0ABW9F493_9FIRM
MSSRKKYIKLAAFVLSAVLLFGNTSTEHASELNQKLDRAKSSLNSIDSDLNGRDDKINSYQNDINVNKGEKNLINQELNKLKNEKSSLEEQVNHLNGNIRNTLNKIYENEVQLIETMDQKADNQKELNLVKDKIGKNTKLLKERLVIMYKMGDAQKVEVLLSSENFNDFLSRNKMMTTITKNDKKLIESLKDDKLQLDKLTTELSGQKKVLEVTKENLEKEKNELDIQKNEKEKLLDEVKNKEGQDLEKISQLDSFINEYESKISEKISEKKNLQTKKASLESEISNIEKQINLETESAKVAELRSKKAELENIEEKQEAKSEVKQKENNINIETTTKVVDQTSKPEVKKVTISSSTSSSPLKYTINDFKWHGVIYWGGHKFTYYSESVLPGYGLDIPGRYTSKLGYVTDKDGYIVLASNPRVAIGKVIDTPFGAQGKVYDRCESCSIDWFDVYTR